MTRLPQTDWLDAAPTQYVIGALEAERGGSARFVGGCVRNAILEAPAGDIDIATQLTPDVVERVLKAAGCAVHQTGLEHGTLTVVCQHQPFEITTLRRDVETDGRRAVVAFTEDWKEDASRRDFTINALYADANGEVMDPTGQGLRDIEARRVVFVGDAETRIREDYLRILRFFRFYAWYAHGDPDAEAMRACAAHADGLSRISAERIWDEFKKLISAPAPETALYAMQDAGVLASVIPEACDIERLSHMIAAERADGAAPDPLLRLLAFGPASGAALLDLARRMKASNDERARLLAPARSGETIAPDIDDRSLLRMAYRVGRSVLRDRLMLLRAANPEQEADWKKRISVLDDWERPTLPVGGVDVIAAGIEEGPRIGPILRAVEGEWVASDFKLTRQALLARIEELASA